MRDGIPSLLDRPPAEAFTADQAEGLAGIDPHHFWFAARNELLLWAIQRYAPAARTMLEVGCGAGHVLQALARFRPELRLTGTEVSPEALHTARRRVPAAAFLYADTRVLPFDREFDIVSAFDVIEHIPDERDAIQAIARATRPGGWVMVTVPQHQWLWTPLDDYSGHQRRYSRQHLQKLATDAGLTLLRTTSFVSLLLPALAASRLVQRKVRVEPGREFTVSAKVNAAAMALMRAELAAIRAGVSFPAGGSLLLIARRPA